MRQIVRGKSSIVALGGVKAHIIWWNATNCPFDLAFRGFLYIYFLCLSLPLLSPGSTFGVSGDLWSLSAKATVTTMISSFGGGSVALAACYILYGGKMRVALVANCVFSSLVAITGEWTSLKCAFRFATLMLLTSFKALNELEDSHTSVASCKFKKKTHTISFYCSSKLSAM